MLPFSKRWVFDLGEKILPQSGVVYGSHPRFLLLQGDPRRGVGGRRKRGPSVWGPEKWRSQYVDHV